MKPTDLSELADHIRRSPQFQQKRIISPTLGGVGFQTAAMGFVNGDDAAAIPDGDGFLLLAAEAITPSLVRRDPFLAGRSAVLANVNDIYSMGGRPVAIVDVILADDTGTSAEIFRGVADFSMRLQVPVVGGHTTVAEGPPSVSLAILGKAARLITSFNARPGDRMALVYNPDGEWLEDLGFWNSLPGRTGAEHIADLELLPMAAESGLVRAGRDVSMCGIAGTALMLLEASGVGARVELERITIPEGVHPGRWLLAYFSYGFILAVGDQQWNDVVDLFGARSLQVLQIGTFLSGSQLILSAGGRQEVLWDWSAKPFLGFR